MTIIRFLRSQEIGYGLLLAEQQRIQNEIREYVFTVLKDNGGNTAEPWQFDPKTLEWRLPESEDKS